MPLKREFSKTKPNLRSSFKAFLTLIPPAFYAKGIHLLPDRSRKVIDYGGEYFDYTYINLNKNKYRKTKFFFSKLSSQPNKFNNSTKSGKNEIIIGIVKPN